MCKLSYFIIGFVNTWMRGDRQYTKWACERFDLDTFVWDHSIVFHSVEANKPHYVHRLWVSGCHARYMQHLPELQRLQNVLNHNHQEVKMLTPTPVRSTHRGNHHCDTVAPPHSSVKSHLHASPWQRFKLYVLHEAGLYREKLSQSSHNDRNTPHTQRSYSSSKTITHHQSLLLLCTLLFWQKRGGPFITVNGGRRREFFHCTVLSAFAATVGAAGSLALRRRWFVFMIYDA